MGIDLLQTLVNTEIREKKPYWIDEALLSKGRQDSWIHIKLSYTINVVRKRGERSIKISPNHKKDPAEHMVWCEYEIGICLSVQRGSFWSIAAWRAWRLFPCAHALHTNLSACQANSRNTVWIQSLVELMCLEQSRLK